MYANSSNSHSTFYKSWYKRIRGAHEICYNGTADSNELDKLTFNTIDWINENTSWAGRSITDNEEDLKTTTYSLSNEGSSNYLVDQINPSNTIL